MDSNRSQTLNNVIFARSINHARVHALVRPHVRGQAPRGLCPSIISLSRRNRIIDNGSDVGVYVHHILVLDIT